MQNTNEICLDSMSVRELTELREAIHTAIRAAIRRKNESRAAPPAPPVKPMMDLERERDAWLAARRRV